MSLAHPGIKLKDTLQEMFQKFKMLNFLINRKIYFQDVLNKVTLKQYVIGHL